MMGSATVTPRAGVLAALALLSVFIVAACAAGSGGTGAPAATGTAGSPAATNADTSLGIAAQPPSDWDGDVVRATELPGEALSTLRLIADDGPYPYDQDGVHVPEP